MFTKKIFCNNIYHRIFSCEFNCVLCPTGGLSQLSTICSININFIASCCWHPNERGCAIFDPKRSGRRPKFTRWRPEANRKQQFNFRHLSSAHFSAVSTLASPHFFLVLTNFNHLSKIGSHSTFPLRLDSKTLQIREIKGFLLIGVF